MNVDQACGTVGLSSSSAHPRLHVHTHTTPEVVGGPPQKRRCDQHIQH